MSGILRKVTEKHFIAGASAITAGSVIGTETGRDILKNPGIYATAASETAIAVGLDIYKGTSAMVSNPTIAAKCFPIGAMEAIQNPIAYFAGVYKDPRKGSLTGPYIKGVGLTDTEIESDACQAAITTGGLIPGIGSGALTAKIGIKAFQLTTKATGRELAAKTLVGRAFSSVGKTGAGMTVNAHAADFIHGIIQEDEHPSTVAKSPAPAPAGVH